MKRSEYGKLVRLAKRYLKEEKDLGETEIEVMPKQKKPAEKVPVQPVQKAAPRPAAGSPTLEEFRAQIEGCRKCPLGKTRLNFVFGVGNPKAELMFIGEGPGFDEDHKGEPFVGRAGQLLNKIIEAINFKREDVYIANIVKCHPMIDPKDPEKHGNDRPPSPEEAAACLPYLQKQIEIIKPRLICALGSSAARTLLATEEPIGKLRGKFVAYHGIRLMPTYHPAALLRNPALKKDVWEDMKKLRDALKG